jgi:hypothetical protein
MAQSPAPVFTLPNLKQIEFQSDASWQEITAAILSIILLLLLLRYLGPLCLGCCRKLKKAVRIVTPNVEFIVTLSVGNTAQYISLPLLSLPFTYEEYDFKAEKFLTGLAVESYICPHLELQWQELEISHKFAPLIYHLPRSVNLTYLQAYKLRQILRHPHFALFHIRWGTQSRILPLLESVWSRPPEGPNVQQRASRSITLPRGNPPLYQQLQQEAAFV